MNERPFPSRGAKPCGCLGGDDGGVAADPRSAAAEKTGTMLLRAIPSTGEKIPAVGLGTSRTFNVGDSPEEREPLKEVLRRFVQLGGKVVDTSPMYGRAESVVGDLTSELNLRDKLFLATKVWTTGKQAGIDEMERSLALLRTKRLDLIQVHNLVDLDTQLATLRAWKAEGRIRYLGITHYNESSFPEVEKILRREKLDFLQINYSIAERRAEETNPAVGARERRCHADQPAVCPGRSLLASAREAAARVGRGVRLQIVGAISSQVDPGQRRRHLCDSRDRQRQASGRQHGGGGRPVARCENAAADDAICCRALARPPREHDAFLADRDVVRAAQYLDRDDAVVGQSGGHGGGR